MVKRLITTLIICVLSSAVSADVFVIVNANNSVESLKKKKVIDLFMGRVTAFPNNKPAVTLDLKAGHEVRETFYKALTGKSEAQVDAYWATLVFAGRMSQPTQFDSEQEVIRTVAENEATIAFVSEENLPDTVKVVLQLTTD